MNQRKPLKTALITILISFSLVICFHTANAASETSTVIEYNDIQNHWAREAIYRWSEHQILTGYADGSFRPDNPVTRAELSTIVCRMLGFPNAASNAVRYSTIGMNPNDWYYQSVSIMLNYRFLWAPYGEYNVPMTREQAIYLISKAFGVQRYEIHSTPIYSDSAFIVPYAEFEIADMQYYGFVGGYPDGTFRPNNNITRAEVITIIDNMINHYIKEPGVYEFDDDASILVTCSDVTLVLNGQVSRVFIDASIRDDNAVIVEVDENDDWIIFHVGFDSNLVAVQNIANLPTSNYIEAGKFIFTDLSSEEFWRCAVLNYGLDETRYLHVSMASMINYLNYSIYFEDDPNRKGHLPIWVKYSDNVEKLRNVWGVTDAESLDRVVMNLLNDGHNSIFQNEVSEVAAMSENVIADFTSLYSDGYMFKQLLDWHEKWGETGIIAWDLFRIADIVYSSRDVRYISKEEELMYLELASEKLRYYFNSWDEAYDNYLDGYAWWTRADISNERPRESYWVIMRGFYPDVFCDKDMFP